MNEHFWVITVKNWARMLAYNLEYDSFKYANLMHAAEYSVTAIVRNPIIQHSP